MAATAWLGIVVCAAALGAAGYALAAPGRPRIALQRLDPNADEQRSRLAGAAEDTTALAGRALERFGRSDRLQFTLEQAGMTLRPADLVVVTGGVALGAGALGILLGGLGLGLLFALLAPMVVAYVVVRRRRRRQAAFAEQLDDALQLMASSLRAGHSLMRAIDAVSRDTESPTAEEFSRVVNEARLGRDVNAALEEVAARTGSEDFAWLVQAVAIHREVGGNLAEVLDSVGVTIRERNDLRRRARVLSAEGRTSGIVLFVMPLGVSALLALASPDYMSRLLSSAAGLVVLVVSAALMAVGAFWVKSVVKVRF